MKAHPLAELFPLLSEEDTKSLANKIKANGLRLPITRYEGMILEGRNRFNACQIAGVKPTFEDYDGDDPLQFVLDMNFERRHLSVKERADIGAKLSTMKVGRPKTDSKEAITEKEAAKRLKVSRSSIQRAKKAAQPKKKKAAPPASWTHESLKKDKELLQALKQIDKAWGHDDTAAIRKGDIGLSRKEIIELSKEWKLEEMRDLIIVNRWKPKDVVKFLNQMMDEDSTVEDLQNWCLATIGKVFSADISGFRITCALIKKGK